MKSFFTRGVFPPYALSCASANPDKLYSSSTPPPYMREGSYMELSLEFPSSDYSVAYILNNNHQTHSNIGDLNNRC